MSFGKKDEDAESRGVFYDKSQVLLETRVFNETPLNPRKSRLLLGKVLTLLYTGEHLTRAEATDLFFATTKLFQNKDPGLRQIIYLLIKELADKADDVLMVTSSLTKDINAKPEELFASPNLLSSAAASFGFSFGSRTTSLSSASAALGAGAGPGAILGTNVCHRANALRAICRIMDPSTIPAIERFLKQAIVDRTAAVSTAALVSSYHVFPVARDLVRRWVNEVQEALTSPKVTSTSPSAYLSTGYIVQYHALGLLYLIRQADRMAVAKLVQSLARTSNVRSQWAQCMLVRFAVKCCEDESASFGGKNMVSVDGSLSAAMYEYLKSLCNNNDMVMLEAARALVSMVNSTPASLTATQVQPAVTALQQLLVSPKPALKFAALRTLHQLAQVNASLVTACNIDMEQLVSDSNRSIATFAITTLLKTGTESSVDRLMKQISSFMSEISDEFKVIIIDAIRVLAVKFPAKQAVMLSFLASVLRDEGGYEYKRSVVEAIFDLVKVLPDCLETALAHLCEFIEDCEFTKLAVRILHLLGAEGPKTRDPAKYLRYIYNRVILENSNVRAAAVTALAAFGAHVDAVRPTVRVLLTRCLDDPDDEVRDRATFNLAALDQAELRAQYLLNDTVLAVPTLQAKLAHYTAAGDFAHAVDVAAVPRIPKAELVPARRRAGSPTRGGAMNSPMLGSPAMRTMTPTLGPATPTPSATAAGAAPVGASTQWLEKEPLLAPLLPTLFKSTSSVALTDRELEYHVSVVKHVFRDWLVLEIEVVNTMPEVLLENVAVALVPDTPIDTVMKQMAVVPIASLKAHDPQRVFVAFQRAPGAVPTVSFATKLTMTVKDCDPVTHVPDSDQGYPEEFAVEDVDITLADYMLPTTVPDFSSAWDSLDEPSQVVETLQVPGIPTLAVAVAQIVDLLGMRALEGSNMVPAEKHAHTLVLGGVFLGGVPVLVRVRMVLDAGAQAVAMEVAVRAGVPEVAQVVAQALQG
ncbi:coatomer subunit gamma [Allomyces arbusculus]|nr:coatomer subunit gamma [Allomyces arbusculus]